MADFTDEDVTAAAQAPRRGDLPSSRSEASSASARAPVAYCLRRAEMMFACYRRDEAANPEIYCAAIASVLGEYVQTVVDVVTDPRTGIPSKIGFLPSVKEVRDACEAEGARQWRAAHASPKPNLNRDYVPPENFPGCRANVFVPIDAPQYQAVMAWKESGEADPRDWLEGRAGIHVALSAFQQCVTRLPKTWKSPNADDIRESLNRLSRKPAEGVFPDGA
jgi:hypothetical protein